MVRLPAMALALTASGAVAQGVPEIDVSALAQMQSINAGEQAQMAEQAQISATLTQNLGSRTDQIAALQDTINMLRGSSAMTTDLEGLDGMVASAVYSIEDNNPYAGRLFGDARETIESMIAQTAVKFGNDPALAAIGINAVEFRCWFQALVKQESRFQIGARSPKAAFGLTQIIPGTAQDLGIYPAYYTDPQLQLDGGARYLMQQIRRFKSMPLALAAYNAGPGAVMKYDGIPPYRETQDYVKKISGFYNTYAAQISGADQTGTLALEDISISEMSNISDAAMSYAGYSQEILIQSLSRLQEILRRISLSASAKEAMDLNSYAKAEVTRMAGVLTRLMAVKRKAEWAQYGMLFAAYARDREFFEGVTR
ncbi:Transglycosylase SLT domain-containing protein [Loktanella salsilacus]|uniref:Transglycosylase SLT domain-containing protein n=1 Tax=Loktanella salsilacus TaxID=195913 RepID=A0A1I4JVI9_9RHOB|nr:lytic transglycosylase domain-containing protein [Loktanella salsilacus]SFL70253.1 Transglycosylase SLT domain-containing protein [Loktanella salsilacus]